MYITIIVLEIEIIIGMKLKLKILRNSYLFYYSVYNNYCFGDRDNYRDEIIVMTILIDATSCFVLYIIKFFMVFISL